MANKKTYDVAKDFKHYLEWLTSKSEKARYHVKYYQKGQLTFYEMLDGLTEARDELLKQHEFFQFL